MASRAPRFAALAWRELSRSEEFVTQRLGYYRAISNLYYLYDDFNDRNIHYNHAIQMAGMDLAYSLKGCLVKHSVPPLTRKSVTAP